VAAVALLRPMNLLQLLQLMVHVLLDACLTSLGQLFAGSCSVSWSGSHLYHRLPMHMHS
jgi:hypothetical protein